MGLDIICVWLQANLSVSLLNGSGLRRSTGNSDSVCLSILVGYRVSDDSTDWKRLLFGLRKGHQDETRAPFTSAVATSLFGAVVE